jgi:hypothetical protein
MKKRLGENGCEKFNKVEKPLSPTPSYAMV